MDISDLLSKENVTSRLNSLISKGSNVELLTSSLLTLSKDNPSFISIRGDYIRRCQEWLCSVINLIRVLVGENGYFYQQCSKIPQEIDETGGINSITVTRMLGLLISFRDAWKAGLVKDIEYVIMGITFDNFLDHAGEYHKLGKKMEASVLASAVLEDTIKKIAKKNGINPEIVRELDPLITELAKIGIFTQVKAKRARGYAGTRNHAFHAEWDRFDLNDVKNLIEGTREMIQECLDT